ncbi:22420_t:CDS:2, partial [Rhizophagus irregularis]
FYKYINSEISEKLKINYKNDKESPFVKGWWHGIGINNYESLLEFSQGFNFGSNQVILKDKASENLYLNQYKKIEWILKSNKNVFLIFKEILKDVETKYYDSIQSCIIDCTPSSRKKYYKLFTEDEWNEICDANLSSYQEDDFIIYSSISSHIKKSFKWIEDKQSNILTLPLPLFEENELNIEANIYNFILQSIGDKMNLGFQNRKHLFNQLFNNKNNSDYGRKSDFFVNDNQNNVFLLAEVTGPPYKRKPKKELFDYGRNHQNGKDELEYRNLSIIYKYGSSLTEEHIEKLMKVINIFLLQIHTNVLNINILDQPGNKNSSQPDEYLTKPLSIHANQLLYSSAITCPTPRSSPE